MSIFSVDSTELEEQGANANIFDLFLAEFNLDSELVQGIVARETSSTTKSIIFSLKLVAYTSIDPKSIITFITVDFYDHDT